MKCRKEQVRPLICMQVDQTCSDMGLISSASLACTLQAFCLLLLGCCPRLELKLSLRVPQHHAEFLLL